MQRTWAAAPVAAVTVLAVQMALPLPALATGGPDLSMDLALAAVEQAVSWQCDLPHRTAAQRGAAQRALRPADPAPGFVQRSEALSGPAGPNPRPIPGFGSGPGQNPRVKINGSLPGPGSVDVYQVPMRAGEVFTATVRGAGGTLEVRDPAAVLVEGSSIDRSGIYPPSSPLLGGGNATVDHVASVSGTHTVTVRPAKPGAASGSTGDESGSAPGAGAPAPSAGTPGTGSAGAPGTGSAGASGPSDVLPGDADPGDDGLPAGAAPDPAQVPVAGSAAAPSAAAVDSGTRVLPPVALEASRPDPAPSTTPSAPGDPGTSSPSGAPSPAGVPSRVGAPSPAGASGAAGSPDPAARNSEPVAGPAAVTPSEIPAPPGSPPDTDPRSYQLDLGVFRPRANTEQKVVLEFGGATIDTRRFGLETANNDVKLSALSTFLPRFGLTAADQPELEKRVLDTVRENLSAAVGGGPVDVSIAGRPGASAFGRPGVSRVVIGGSSTEAGIPTVGIAESVDPGNFAHEETALVLLDRLSGPGTETVSLAHYLPGVIDRNRRIEFVGRALGNIASHEAGHFLGSWHTDATTPKHDLMAPGDVVGAFGFGADKLGGTLDDVRSRFGQDRFAPSEGFTGVEDTNNRTLVGLRGMPNPG